jgi:hypothetical protein
MAAEDPLSQPSPIGYYAHTSRHVGDVIEQPDLSCQLNRSTQHFLEDYSQDFEIPELFRYSWALI